MLDTRATAADTRMRRRGRPMRRTAAALTCVAALAAILLMPAHAAQARPASGLSTAGAVVAGTATAQGTWVRGTLTRTQPERRFPVTVAATGRHVITLGGLTGPADLVLLDGSGRQLAASARRGPAFERITRVLTPGSYEVVVRRPASSTARVGFALRIDRMVTGMAVSAARFTTTDRGRSFDLRFVLTNNTASPVQLGGIRVALRDAQGRLVREVATSCLTRRYLTQVMGPGDWCLVETGGSLVRLATTYRVVAEVGTPASAPVLRATGLRVTRARDTSCTGPRRPCSVVNRRVTNAGAGTAREVILETARWDAYGRLRDVSWSWTQPRLRAGRSVVMPAYTVTRVRPRLLTSTALAGPWNA